MEEFSILIKKASVLGNLPDLGRSFKSENSLKKTNVWLADNVAELGRFNFSFPGGNILVLLSSNGWEFFATAQPAPCLAVFSY